jgi:phage major head subunit gpT-like protein
LFKKQQSLGKQAVTSQFSKEATTLYGMSKANRESFLQAFPEYQKYLGEAEQLDQALAAKGWIKTAKLAGGKAGAKKAAKLGIRLKTRKHKAPTFGTYKASKKLKVKL